MKLVPEEPRCAQDQFFNIQLKESEGIMVVHVYRTIGLTWAKQCHWDMPASPCYLSGMFLFLPQRSERIVAVHVNRIAGVTLASQRPPGPSCKSMATLAKGSQWPKSVFRPTHLCIDKVLLRAYHPTSVASPQGASSRSDASLSAVHQTHSPQGSSS
jgi:hypothetical protein